jgi:hypothetical protein
LDCYRNFFILYFEKGKKYSFTAIAFYSTLGFVIFEFLQMFIPWSTFDFLDILGSVIGFILAPGMCYIANPEMFMREDSQGKE